MLAQTATAAAAGVTVVSAYPANKGPGWKQTIDVAGAVGPKHVVDFDESGFVVHDKTTEGELPPIDPYMKLGVDKNGLYVCSSNGEHDWQKAMNCYVIPKRDVVAPGGPVLTHARTFTGLSFAAMPAIEQNTISGFAQGVKREGGN